MSRSKNYYQGMHLGRVQRSEYDDSRMRDHARQDAKLGESLKTVDRARNVMKKSMEADKQMFMKAGSQTSVKPSVPVLGAHTRLSPKAAPRLAKPTTEPRVKRFSVTDMPSDLARSNHNSGRTLSRPISFHEMNYEPGNPGPPLGKEHRSLDKLSDSSSGNIGPAKASYHHNHAEATTSGTCERSCEHDSGVTPEGERRGIHSTHRSVAETSRQWKAPSKADLDKPSESRARQKELSSGLAEDVSRKTDDQTTEKSEEMKNQRHEQGSPQDQDTQPRFRKRSNLWETLSTPKHTSLTKSKRSQIEMEFTKSGMTSSKSSPTLYSATRVKPTTGQGRPPLPRSGSVQGRQVNSLKGKQTASSRS